MSKRFIYKSEGQKPDCSRFKVGRVVRETFAFVKGPGFVLLCFRSAGISSIGEFVQQLLWRMSV